MNRPFERLCVVGLGYVGLPTAAVFASRGLAVLGVDVNARTVEMVNRGEVPIVEPDLDIVLTATVQAGRLRAATAPQAADAFVLAVPTPFAEGHRPDLSFVEAATRAVAPVLRTGDLVVVESTVPVGTTEKVSGWLAAMRPDLAFPHIVGEAADVCIAHSPERVLPGRVLLELVGNDRVIGGLTPRCAERAAQLYKLAVSGRCLLTSARTAELVKLAENAFRDVNVAFANELSRICDRLGIDVWEAIALANHHPRVNILKPGPGVGGHCVAVDPWFLVDSAPDDSDLIRAARKVNDGKPRWVADKVRAAAKARRSATTIACLGLAYKADTDDLRESPAVEVVAMLARARAGRLLAVEPYVSALPPELTALPDVVLANLEDALAASDIIVVLADHSAFAEIDRDRLAGKIVIDTRGLWR